MSILVESSVSLKFTFFFCTCCRYLIEHGAHVGAVNSEGELPLDVATEDAMARLLKAEIKKQGERYRA